MTASARLLALRALVDLGVVRARADAAGYADLWRGGLASMTPGEPEPICAFRLTVGGKAEAARLLGGGALRWSLRSP